MGMSGVIKSALLAEVFGKDNIGTVRSVFTAVAVLGTAVGAANSFRLWKLEKA